MERDSSFTSPEVVGIATAAAAAIGGVIVALGRSQAATARARVEQAAAAASPTTTAANERRREIARLVAEALSARYPHLREEASGIVSRAATASRPAASRLTSAAQERAGTVRSTGATAAERFQETVVPAAASVVDVLRERAAERKAMLHSVSATEVTAPAVSAASAVATKTGSGARDAFAMLMWLLTAGVIAYVAMLDAERREQVKRTVAATVEQIGLLVRDFQGYEDDI